MPDLNLSSHPQQRALRADAQANDAEAKEQWPHRTNSLPKHAPLKQVEPEQYAQARDEK